ncbi:contractile injection system protein, VgrG/Pvc8 family [Succinimonas sp.]|uniref:contractile injection system protein, VgrG/Pvc8 family n=1 Tax=Succinimonas sp. TaxID=1936151 RepID=UPI00386B6000
MFKKEISISFANSCPLSDAMPYRCVVNEGLSIPFQAEVTLFSGSALTKKDLESCLLLKADLLLLQYDTTGNLSRGRNYQGIVTSFNSLGLVSDPNGVAGGDDCYGYEITIEPEMVLTGLDLRTRSFDSESSPADIITAIFQEYNLPCRFDKNLFDLMPDRGQIAQQTGETDLNFINRLCFCYGFNYVFEPSGEDASGQAETVFSRGWRTGNAKQLSGNTLSGLEEIPCAMGAADAKSFGSGVIYLDRLVSTGFAGSGSIHKDSKDPAPPPAFLSGFEAVRGEGPKPAENIIKFGRASAEALDRLYSDRVLVTAHDFAVAPGIKLNISDERYLTVRTRYSFNIDFPENFNRPPEFPEKEQELMLHAVAVPQPDDDATLGPLCCFGRLPENPTIKNAFLLSAIPRPQHRRQQPNSPALRTHAALGADAVSAPLVIKATVTDSSGEVPSPGVIVPADDDDTAFPAMFYSLPDGATQPVKTNFVSATGGADPLGNFPKTGQRVLLLQADNCCFFMGYLPDRDALPGYDSSMRNDLILSSFLNSGCDPDGDAGAAKMPDNSNRDINNQYLAFCRFSGSAVLVEYLIMQKKLEGFMKCLALRFNTNKIIEILDSKKSDADSKLKDVIDARKDLDKAITDGDSQDDINKAKNSLADAYSALASVASDIVSSIKGVKAVSDKLSAMMLSSPGTYTSNDQALEHLLGLTGFSLFCDGTHREYGVSLERAASEDITAVAGGNLSLRAEGSIVINADTSITLQVGNSSLSINGNTIAMAVAYFKNKFSPWDGRIALSPMTGVSLSGFQVSAKGLMSASMGDSFGGSVGTRAGYMTMSAPKLKLCNMGGPTFLTTMTNLTARVANAVADTSCAAAGNDDADLAASIINDISGYANSISGLIADSKVAYKTFKGETKSGVRNVRAWVNLAISAVNIAMNAADVLENLIACTIIQNSDSNYAFVKRCKENNYISGHDIYLMTTSSVRMTAMITNAALLMADNLASPTISSMELNASGSSITSMQLDITGKMNTMKASALSGTNLEIDDNTDADDDDNKIIEIDPLIKMVAKDTVIRTTNSLSNLSEKSLEEGSTSNLDMKRVDGSTKILVNEDETSAQKTETLASKNESSASKNEVHASDDKVVASKVDGTANKTETNAVSTDTQAVNTETGAMNTNTKAMDISS